jgi:hypothetical protein
MSFFKVQKEKEAMLLYGRTTRKSFHISKFRSEDRLNAFTHIEISLLSRLNCWDILMIKDLGDSAGVAEPPPSGVT